MRRALSMMAAVLVGLSLAACGGGGGGGGSSPSTSPTVTSPLTITTTSVPDGVQGASYSTILTATGGSGTRTWSHSAGTLPPGVQLASDGQLSGTPTTVGAFTFTARVVDSSSTATASLTLNIREPLKFAKTGLPDATENVPYAAEVVVTGGLAPYTISVPQPASLPPGLSLEGNEISGTPTTVGTFTFAVNASDSATPAQAITANFTIRVHSEVLSVTTLSLPAAETGQPYSVPLEASGGAPPYVWSLVSGALPPGIELSASGLISGTTADDGTFDFTVEVNDSALPPRADTRAFSLEVRKVSVTRNDSIASATPLSNGTHRASISPYADPPDLANPDRDFYRLTAAAGSTVTVETFARRLVSTNLLDTVIEVVDGNGQRFQTCRDPGDDNPGGFPIAPDPTPEAFDDSCMNDDIILGVINDSRLEFLVPGDEGSTVTFYVHVFDWSGHARPDMIYDLVISGVD